MFYKNRPYLMEVLKALGDLGYEVDFKLLNAKHYEVPQNRERLIVVGHDGSFEWPEPGAGPLVTAGRGPRRSRRPDPGGIEIPHAKHGRICGPV